MSGTGLAPGSSPLVLASPLIQAVNMPTRLIIGKWYWYNNPTYGWMKVQLESFRMSSEEAEVTCWSPPRIQYTFGIKDLKTRPGKGKRFMETK